MDDFNQYGQQPYGQPQQFDQTQQQAQYSQTQQQFNQAQYSQPQYGQPVYQAPVFDRYASIQNYHSYIMGIVAYASIIGFLIAILSTPSNERTEYLAFQANQALVLFLFSLLSVIPVLGWIWSIFMVVNYIMAIIDAAKGEQKSATFFGNIRIIK